jgi:hypothetical protein
MAFTVSLTVTRMTAKKRHGTRATAGGPDVPKNDCTPGVHTIKLTRNAYMKRRR